MLYLLFYFTTFWESIFNSNAVSKRYFFFSKHLFIIFYTFIYNHISVVSLYDKNTRGGGYTAHGAKIELL